MKVDIVLPRSEVVDAEYSRAFRTMLANRGVSERELNLEKAYEPFDMDGIDEAVDRIIFALKNRERVLIHGDYDADGITALALLGRVFKDLGLKFIPYVPDRFSEGYGFSKNSIEFAKSNRASLIITVDCGISSYEEVELAKSRGIDVIITDHHLKPPRLPDCIVVHPQGYMNEKLTGVGVSFKLAHALVKKLANDYEKRLYFLLDLFAVGTLADLGEVLGENRLLVKHGLNVLSGKYTKAGFKALYRNAGISPPIKTWHINYIIAPRLNAAGRMDTAMKAFDLLMKTKGKDALSFAEEIERLNSQRQSLQAKTLKELMKIVNEDEPVVFVFKEGIHEGIMGIVASKLVEEFVKPVFVIDVNGELSRGSVRGIESFNVFECLNHVGHIFENYGGHALAGGFTIRTERLRALKEHVNEYAKKVAPTGFRKVIRVDAEIYEEELLDERFWEDKEKLEPYGPGFPEPIFLLKAKNIKREGNIFIANENIYLRTKEDIKGEPIITNLRRVNGGVFADVVCSTEQV